eukprot:Skav217275  [mRNA]  locus=scaffold120:132597:133537:- [translate_table: standard]
MGDTKRRFEVSSYDTNGSGWCQAQAQKPREDAELVDSTASESSGIWQADGERKDKREPPVMRVAAVAAYLVRAPGQSGGEEEGEEEEEEEKKRREREEDLHFHLHFLQ